MIKDNITPQDAVDLLNDALSKDRMAISSLFNSKMICNDDLLDHPTIQCGMTTVGVLGIINGLFGVNPENGYGAIYMEVDDNLVITKFGLCKDLDGTE